MFNPHWRYKIHHPKQVLCTSYGVGHIILFITETRLVQFSSPGERKEPHLLLIEMPHAIESVILDQL